jgi:hypothetical protein
MSPQNVVEFADRISRRRALGTALATIVFLAIQVVVRPVFRTDGYAASGPRAYMWALNAALLLLLLLPAGGFVWGRRVRTLVNDEVSRNNSRTAMAAGFWVAMAIALGLYALPASRGFNAREAIYLIATPTTGVALLAFAWLESRAHRGG